MEVQEARYDTTREELLFSNLDILGRKQRRKKRKAICTNESGVKTKNSDQRERMCELDVRQMWRGRAK